MRYQVGKVRWLLLLAMALVLGAAAALWWTHEKGDWDLGLVWPLQQRGTAPLAQSLSDMDQAIAQLTQQVSELEQQLTHERAELAAQVAAQDDAIDQSETALGEAIEGALQQTRQSVAEALAAMDEMQDRIARMQVEQDEVMDALRERGQALPPVDRNLMQRLVLVEAVTLLNLGQQRLELADDQAGAVALYRQAAAALTALDEARLGPVLRQIQREQAEIEALPRVDWGLWQSRVLQLQATARRLAGEPVAAQGMTDSADRELAVEGIDQRRWRERVQRGVGALVTVRPREADDSAVIDHRLRQQQLNAWLDMVLLGLYQHDAELTRQAARRAGALWPGAVDSEAMEWLNALEALREPSLDIELGGAAQRLRSELEARP